MRKVVDIIDLREYNIDIINISEVIVVASKEIVLDVSNAFSRLGDGMEKGYVLGVMQGMLLSREKETPKPQESGPGVQRKIG